MTFIDRFGLYRNVNGPLTGAVPPLLVSVQELNSARGVYMAQVFP